MHTQVAIPPTARERTKSEQPHDLVTLPVKATNMKPGLLQYSSLPHIKGGIHEHFVMSGENLLLKTFVEPQLAKFSSFTGNIDM